MYLIYPFVNQCECKNIWQITFCRRILLKNPLIVSRKCWLVSFENLKHPKKKFLINDRKMSTVNKSKNDHTILLNSTTKYSGKTIFIQNFWRLYLHCGDITIWIVFALIFLRIYQSIIKLKAVWLFYIKKISARVKSEFHSIDLNKRLKKTNN